MKVLITLSEIIINAGIANGFLLPFLFRTQQSYRSRKMLSSLLIVLALIILRIHYIFPYLREAFGAPLFLSGPFVFLLSPFLFFYLRSIVHPSVALSKSDWLHFLPFGLYLIFFIPPYFLGFDSDYAFYLNSFIGTPWVFLIVQLVYYLIQIHKQVGAYQEDIVEKYSNVEGMDVVWLKHILWVLVVVLIYIVIGMPLLMHGINVSISFTVSSIFFSIVLFFIAFKGMQQRIPEITNGNEVYAKEITDDSLNSLKEKLLIYMNESKPFLDPELTLVELARQVDMSRNQLSQVINTGIGENFYLFINKYRIDEVKRLIKEDAKKQYTIISLANDAGFNSKSSFNHIFKKITGLTPSQYREGHS